MTESLQMVTREFPDNFFVISTCSVLDKAFLQIIECVTISL